MAIVSTVGNYFKLREAQGANNYSADVYKIILMNNTFVYDPDTHDTLADVTADQLATGGGYTQDNEILGSVSVTRDDANDRIIIAWATPTWTGSGGGFGPSGSALIYNDSEASDMIVGAVDYGTDETVAAGVDFSITTPTIYKT